MAFIFNGLIGDKCHFCFEKRGDNLIRIAIVDDEKFMREHIEKLIENKQVECLIDTYSVGETLLQADKCYDIVFLDIQMDGMNGSVKEVVAYMQQWGIVNLI